MSDDYRTNANADELRERIRGLEETVSQLRGEHRSAYRRWWAKNWGHVVGWPMLAVFTMICMALISSCMGKVEQDFVNRTSDDEDFHDAQLACMPGWIERLDTGRYQWRPHQSVICTDSKKRWVVKR